MKVDFLPLPSVRDSQTVAQLGGHPSGDEMVPGSIPGVSWSLDWAGPNCYLTGHGVSPQLNHPHAISYVDTFHASYSNLQPN